MLMRIMNEDTSAAAFPSPGAVLPSGEQQGAYAGMSQRDYFAARAMSALIAARPNFKAETVASSAYEMADAMLKVQRDGYLVAEWKEKS